jgi:hypothetical protein
MQSRLALGAQVLQEALMAEMEEILVLLEA